VDDDGTLYHTKSGAAAAAASLAAAAAATLEMAVGGGGGGGNRATFVTAAAAAAPTVSCGRLVCSAPADRTERDSIASSSPPARQLLLRPRVLSVCVRARN